MNRIKAFFKDWSTLEKAWLAFVLVFQTVAWAIQREDLFMLVLTLSSSLNLVLGAKGKIAGLYFAILNSLLNAINCFSIPLYGEIMYNLLYSIPVSATAIILWRKNQSQTGEVKFRTMTTLFALGTIGATGMGTLAYARILAWMGGNFAWMDSLTTVVSVIASMLYLLRYSEQWLMWVIVNALSIVMWILVFLSGNTSAVLIIIMKSVNLCNAVYGYWNWKKIADRVENQAIL